MNKEVEMMLLRMLEDHEERLREMKTKMDTQAGRFAVFGILGSTVVTVIVSVIIAMITGALK